MIDLVVAVSDVGVLMSNLGSSPCLHNFNVIYKHGYSNIPKAYNEAETTGEMVVYVHQDVLLPTNFYADLLSAAEEIKQWDVLGVAGVKLIDGKKFNRGHILDRGKEWGGSTNLYGKVDTLDELLLVTKGDIKFDEQFEQDFYGADICMGRKCYYFNSFVHHNSSRKVGGRTESFYKSEELFRKKHIDKLPIVTTCSLIS